MQTLGMYKIPCFRGNSCTKDKQENHRIVRIKEYEKDVDYKRTKKSVVAQNIRYTKGT